MSSTFVRCHDCPSKQCNSVVGCIRLKLHNQDVSDKITLSLVQAHTHTESPAPKGSEADLGEDDR